MEVSCLESSSNYGSIDHEHNSANSINSINRLDREYRKARAYSNDALPEKEVSSSSRSKLPTTYTAANARYPAKEAYLDSLKSQFFSLGFSFGLSVQMFGASLLVMFISTSFPSDSLSQLALDYYPVFRGMILICFFFLLYGFCIFIWRRNGIDYKAVLNTSYALTYQYVLRASNVMSYLVFTFFVLYILTFIGFLDTVLFNVDRNTIKHLWPACAVFLPIGLFLCPFDRWTSCVFGVRKRGFTQRLSLLQEVGAVFLSPFSTVTFFRVFVADVFCSLPNVIPDLQYTMCIYGTGEED